MANEKAKKLGRFVGRRAFEDRRQDIQAPLDWLPDPPFTLSPCRSRSRPEVGQVDLVNPFLSILGVVSARHKLLHETDKPHRPQGIEQRLMAPQPNGAHGHIFFHGSTSVK